MKIIALEPHMKMRNPTTEAYSEFQQAYDHFNVILFGSSLPTCLITLHRESKRTRGYFAHNRFVRLNDGRTATDEIAMNPMHFATRTVVEVLSTLAHEMVHLWQAHCGKPSRVAYHNKEWAAKMKEIGLQPTDTGEPGGKETGQKMTHYIIEGGAFERAANDMVKSGFMLSWADAASGVDQPAKPTKSGSRIKYTCPECAANAWGKSGLKLICGECAKLMTADDGEEADEGET